MAINGGFGRWENHPTVKTWLVAENSHRFLCGMIFLAPASHGGLLQI